eukprot:1195948-Prorocentrum_minimum.AAC.2
MTTPSVKDDTLITPGVKDDTLITPSVNDDILMNPSERRESSVGASALTPSPHQSATESVIPRQKTCAQGAETCMLLRR